MKLLSIVIGLAWSDCPPDWIRRGESKWCYKPFEGETVTWNTAQSTCVKYGSDLVSYESKEEMEWVYNQLNWNKGKATGAWRNYWMGLNDLQTHGRLEWVSTHPGEEIEYSYQNFAGDADMHDSSRRCAFSLFSENLPGDYGHEGKWYKESVKEQKQ